MTLPRGMTALDTPALQPLRRLWKALPLPLALRRAVMPWVHREVFRIGRVRREVVAGVVVVTPEPRPVHWLAKRPADEIAPGDLIVSGFLSMHTGIGRSGRMIAEGWSAGGARPRLHDLTVDMAGATLADAAPGGVWFSVCNPPEALHFMHVTTQPVFRDRYRIGFWAWELATLPPDWIEALPFFHEVWAGSPFVAEAISRAAEGTDVIVRMVPYPLPDTAAARPDRERFGWRAGELAVLCMYDVRSTAARKNPFGAVDAFQRAFLPEEAAARLVVKVNAPPDAALPDELTRRIAGWPNITLLVAELSDGETDDLLASCDVFVSLHRSEGFGLSIAQAMTLGRAVVATGWSGNADFQRGGVTEVPYTLVPARDPSGRYEAPDQVWAEPDLHAAAAALRRFADEPRAAEAQGARGRRVIAKRLPRTYPAADLAPRLAAAASDTNRGRGAKRG